MPELEELQRQIDDVRVMAEDALDKFPIRSTTTPGASRERHIHDLGKHPGGVIAARVFNSGALTISDNTDTVLTFDSGRYDTNNIHSTSSNTSRLTAKTAGKYIIAANASFAANATNRRLIQFLLNGATLIATQEWDTNQSSANTIMSLSTHYELAVGDYVEVRVFQNSGGDLDIAAVSNYSPEFMMARIGAAGTSGGGTPGTDHGSLTGLGDDDHTLYLLASGSRAGSTGAAQDFGSTGIKADAIAESTGAAGISLSNDTSIAGDLDVTGEVLITAVAADNRGLDVLHELTDSGDYTAIHTDLKQTLSANVTSLASYEAEGAVTLGGFTLTDLAHYRASTAIAGSGTVTTYRALHLATSLSTTPIITTANLVHISMAGIPHASSGDMTGILIGDVGHANWSTVTALDILPQTGVTYYIRQQGVGGVNRFTANTKIGADSDPAVALDVTGAALISTTLGVSGILNAAGKLGIGTTAVPHGGIGWAQVAIEGVNANAAGPHLQFTTASDDFPIFQILPYTHNNCGFNFDSYFDGAWRGSSASSPGYQVYMDTERFRMRYGQAASAGGTLTWKEGLSLGKIGDVLIGPTSSAGDDGVKLTVKAWSSQTSKLQTWTDNSNVVIASINGSGAFVFNENSLDADCRIEGNGEANLFYTDAGNDRVGIATATPTSTFNINGSFAAATIAKTGTYTAAVGDHKIFCDASGGAFTITLPAASGVPGREYHIKKTDSSGNAVTVDANGSETIDGALTQVINVQYDSMEISSDGSNWHIT